MIGTVWEDQQEGGEGKERVLGGEEDWSPLHTLGTIYVCNIHAICAYRIYTVHI
jgi:hypothetical protein